MATTSVLHRWTYNVFVSYRGEDIRKSFIDHLFKDFRQKGIHAFRDDTHFPRGEEISSELYKAIEESRFLMVIFSKSYAFSSWCLRELVKILECKTKGEHKHEVRIIFYDVKPNVVRKQSESFADAFFKHEVSNKTEVDQWRKALFMASNLSGWDLQGQANGYESKLIDSISTEILVKLCDGPLYVGENLVGVDIRLEKMNLLRFFHSNKVHMIGICGIGGIGKTSFAKTIYNLIYIHFEICSFLDDVQGVTKRHGLTHVVTQVINDIMKTTDVRISSVGQGITLMKQRMASRRILLVIDDVDQHDQLEALAGSRDWFSPGSVIIFTSKDKQLLANKVDEIHHMEFLDDVESLNLFSLYAFHGNRPTKDFKELAKQVVQYVKGHPLGLKVLGCFLYGKNVQEWKSELDSLQVFPNEDIQRVLRLSYDGLNLEQKRVFLDIASSFMGVNRDFVAEVLDSCGYFGDTNIRVLVDKSLITISHIGSLQMHDLIQRMAREIVREESKTLGKQSRLWILSDVYDILNENKVTEAVEVLNLLQEESRQKVHIDAKAFTQMKNLRILKICNRELKDVRQPFDLNLWKDSKVNYSGKLEFLSSKLRLLYWHGFPFKFLPSDFYPENIVAIDLSYSHIKNLWTMPKCFRRLKVMKLKHCRNITRTPDFTEIKHLEELILEGCVNLVKVHPSIGMLKKLVVLNMSYCKRFRSFPSKVEMDSLEILNLSGCSKVDKLSDFFDTIQTLKELYVDGTSITQLPSFEFSQRNLQTLSFSPHERILSRCWTSISGNSCLRTKMKNPQILVIPSLIGLCFLQELNFSHCNLLEVPDSIGGLSYLVSLSLYDNNFTSLPRCLSQLSRLRHLGLSGCKKLEVLPELPPSILILDAKYCTSLHELQGLLNHDRSYVSFYFIGCPKLFGNILNEIQVYISQPPPLIFSITSTGYSNQLSSLLRYLNIMGKIRNTEMTFHGNRIPKWFTNQSMGNHVSVELPPDWCFIKCRGYGICVVFTLKKFGHSTSGSGYDSAEYSVNNFDGTSLVNPHPLYLTDMGDPIGIHEPDLVFLHYSVMEWRWKEAKNFVIFSFNGNSYLEVKECGVRLVCDADIEEEADLSTSRL